MTTKTDDEMDDTDVWRVMKKTSQLRRAENRENGQGILTEYDVAFEVAGDMASHLIVRHNGKTVDYWPGTGKWIDRAQRGRHERGVFRLLRHLGITPKARS